MLVVNLHGDPMTEYPFFLGHADEKGAGAGRRLQPQLSDAVRHRLGRSGALRSRTAARKVAAYAPDVLVVSLGVDTFEKDPISQFKLKSEDYPKIGRRIAKLGLPTLFVMEGGYAVDEIGINAVGVLTGFEEG